MSKIQALKEFMGTEKPVTNSELIELRKADSKGFDWMAEECARKLGQTLD